MRSRTTGNCDKCNQPLSGTRHDAGDGVVVCVTARMAARGLVRTYGNPTARQIRSRGGTVVYAIGRFVQGWRGRRDAYVNVPYASAGILSALESERSIRDAACEFARRVRQEHRASPDAIKRRERDAARKRARESALAALGVNAYKRIAVHEDGSYRSIYDPTVVYRSGQPIRSPARAGHGGGVYFYETERGARGAELPEGVDRSRPEAIIAGIARGSVLAYGYKRAADEFVPLLALGV